MNTSCYSRLPLDDGYNILLQVVSIAERAQNGHMVVLVSICVANPRPQPTYSTILVPSAIDENIHKISLLIV